MSQLCQSNPASLFCPPFGAAPVKRLTQCFSLLLWWSYLWQSLCFHAWAAPREEGKTFKSTHAFISVSLRVREREQARMRAELLLHKNDASSQIDQVYITVRHCIFFIDWCMLSLCLVPLFYQFTPKFVVFVCLFIYSFLVCVWCLYTTIVVPHAILQSLTCLKKGTLFLRDWHWHTDMNACRASLWYNFLFFFLYF